MIENKYYGCQDECIRYIGRTIEKSDVMYFDWTCSGFEVNFVGTKLEVQMVAQFVVENGAVLYPWVAVFVDDSEQPTHKFKLEEQVEWYTLFDSETPEKHRIRVIKLTEAQHSKTGVRKFKVAAGSSLECVERTETKKIEYIGDSITCGYGNLSSHAEGLFKTEEEDGWNTYAALVARHIGADFNCVSASGIGILSSYTPNNQINDEQVMPKIYEYTDFYLEQNEERLEKWDFNKFRPHLIVINLGTNDGSYIGYSVRERKEAFKEAYIAFLKQVRQCNGPYTKILCCLGIMGGALYTTIQEAVRLYREEASDGNVDTLLFAEQKIDDGIGANGHPTLKTHQIAAECLLRKIETWE